MVTNTQGSPVQQPDPAVVDRRALEHPLVLIMEDIAKLSEIMKATHEEVIQIKTEVSRMSGDVAELKMKSEQMSLRLAAS